VVSEQPTLLVPITVYVVVNRGLAETIESVTEFNPVDGDHEYNAAPETESVAIVPGHTDNGLLVTKIGLVLTVTTTEAVPIHPKEFVPVTE